MAYRRRTFGRRGARRGYARRRLTGGGTAVMVNPYANTFVGMRRRGRPGLRRKRPGLVNRSGVKRRYRSRAPSRTRVKRQKTAEIAPMQMTVQKYRLGRNMPTNVMLRRLDRIQHNYVMWRYSGMNRCTDTQGFAPLALLGDGAVPTNLCQYPLHLIELSLKPQVTATGVAVNSTLGTIGAVRHVFAQAFNDSINQYQWVAQPGVTSGGVSSNYPELIPTNAMTDSTAALSASVAYGQCYLEWAKVKFCFRTPTQRAGRVCVELIEILEDEASPQITPAASRRREICSSWQHALTGYLYNPIKTDAPLTKTGQPVYRVLKRWVKSFQPQLGTADSDPNANHLRMEFFLRLNKFINFSETTPTGDGGNSTVGEVAGAEPMVNGSDVDTRTPYPLRAKYRRFLLVKGTNYDDVFNTVDPIKHITYDFDIQTKHVFRPGSVSAA